MRLVCMHADTVDALKRLSIRFDDLTPNGLWSSQYHLIGLTSDQADALGAFKIEVEDVTPAQLVQAAGREAEAPTRAAAAEDRRPAAADDRRPDQAAPTPTPEALAGGVRTPPATHALAAEPASASTARGATGSEAEVPLTQGRDAGIRSAEAKAEQRPAGQGVGGSPAPAQKSAPAKGGPAAAPPQAQGGRKGQPQPTAQGGGQRYGTTRLRISVAGKYTEATVANGKIVVAGRTFDSPDQAAAELTKSRGDWTFWEYYDSTDGKWRMLTRDWDTVLKSAAPGGR